MHSIQDIIHRLSQWQKNRKIEPIEKDLLLEDLRTLYRMLSEYPTQEIKHGQPTDVKSSSSTEKESSSLPPVSEKIDLPEFTMKDTKVDLNDAFSKKQSGGLNQQFRQTSQNINQPGFPNKIDQLLDLNTRIFLQKELCHGKDELLSKLLHDLESMPSMAAALDYLHDEWTHGSSPEAVERLRELVRRKFGQPTD